MTQLTIKIDEVTPEIQKTLEHLGALSGVTIEPEKKAKARSQSAWDKAIAAGAVSSKEFHARLENEIRNNW